MDTDIALDGYDALTRRNMEPLRTRLEMSFDKDKVNFTRSWLMSMSGRTGGNAQLQLDSATAGIVVPSLDGVIADVSLNPSDQLGLEAAKDTKEGAYRFFGVIRKQSLIAYSS